MNFKVVFFVSLKIAIVVEPVVHSGSMNTLIILLILICKHGKIFMCILQYILSMTSRFQWMDIFNLCVIFIHKYLISFDIMANVVLFPLSTPSTSMFPTPSQIHDLKEMSVSLRLWPLYSPSMVSEKQTCLMMDEQRQ